MIVKRLGNKIMDRYNKEKRWVKGKKEDKKKKIIK